MVDTGVKIQSLVNESGMTDIKIKTFMKYFSIYELTRSDIAIKYEINNTPNEEVKKNLEKLVDEALDPIREKWGHPIRVNSGYRSPALNAKLKNASKTSAHMRGLAADLNAGSQKANRELYKMIKSMVQHKELVLDQCINECRGGSAWQWIHIGLRDNKKDYRNQFFSLANF